VRSSKPWRARLLSAATTLPATGGPHQVFGNGLRKLRDIGRDPPRLVAGRWSTARSLNQIIPYDAFTNAEVFLTQPLMMVVGDRAGSKWMSDDLLKRAASKDKHMHIVEGSNHMKLYDVYRIAPKARTGYHPRPPMMGSMPRA
jgi:fermentation-respiration switch protein FrsA (DUF1100 family)